MTEKTVTAYKELPFVPFSEGSPVELATFRGDPETGPAASMVRFSVDDQEPRHCHTKTYHSVLIKSEIQTRSKAADIITSEVYGPGSNTIDAGLKFTQQSTQARAN